MEDSKKLKKDTLPSKNQLVSNNHQDHDKQGTDHNVNKIDIFDMERLNQKL